MVENERSIFRNTAFSAAGRGMGDLCTFAFLIVFARSFGRDALGAYSFGMAVGGVLAIFVALGINSMLVREIAKAPAEGPRLVGAIACLQLLIAAFVLGTLLLLSGLLWEDERGRQVLVIMGLYQILWTLSAVFSSYFKAREQMQFAALLEAGHKVLILALGIAAVTLFSEPQIVLLVYPIGAAAAYAGGLALMRRRDAAPRPRLDLGLSRRWFLASLPLFVFNALIVIELRGGIILLGGVAGADAVGLYAAGDRLIAATSLLLAMFAGAVFPVMSRLAASPVELDALLTRCLRLATLFALPVATVLVLLREPIIGWVFGDEFAPAAIVLGILAVAMVPAAANTLVGTLLTARDLLAALLKIRLVGVAAFFTAMAVLVPAQGFVGLAWSVLISKLVTCTVALTYVRRRGHASRLGRVVRGPVAASAGMLVAFELAARLALPVQVVLTLAAGLVMLVAFRGIEMGDLVYLRRIFGKAQ